MTRAPGRLAVVLVLCIAVACSGSVVTAYEPAADAAAQSVAQEEIVLDGASFDAYEGPHVLVEGEVTVDDGQRDLTYSADGQATLAVETLSSGTTVEAVAMGRGETADGGVGSLDVTLILQKIGE